MTHTFKATTATNKIFELKKRIRGVSGGTSASKTISIIIWLIDYAQSTENKVISVVSETLPHLKKGAIRDFINIMQDRHYFKDTLWNKTESTYTFETGSKIEFFSADQPARVRGPRRHILFINEANNISFETYTQLEIRTSEIIWLDWNPVSEFWWYTDVAPKVDHDFLTLTYRDNEALNESIVKTIESRRGNKNWWAVYGEGVLGEAEGRIYKDWKVIDDIPHEARLERYGLDFGYTNDPSACAAVYRYNGGYILDEVLYQCGLVNKQIADVLNNLPPSLVIADSAEPKSIDELRLYGINILPSQKGRGSVLQGIQNVQAQRISVTKNSTNLLKEYRNYLWQTDRDGKIINEPSPIWNHCFVGDTMIATSNGLKRIKDITELDKVLTRKGYQRVLKKWDNGLKRVNNYSLHTDTGTVKLSCTPNHKVWTDGGFIDICKLQSGMTIYLHKNLTESYISCIRGRDTSQEVDQGCTELYGNTTMGIFQKVCRFITRIITRGTTTSKTSHSYQQTNTFRNTLRNALPITQNGSPTFIDRALSLLRLGMDQKKGSNGTRNMEKRHGRGGNISTRFVTSVVRPTKQDTVEYPSSVTLTVKLRHLEVEEGRNERVYDLTVSNSHEYFANGILVHNCLDAVRYAMESLRPNDGVELPPDDTNLFSGGFY